MKTIRTTLATLALCASLATTFTSCSNAKDDEPVTPAANSVAGTYYGNLTSTVMGNESLFENMNVVLTAIDDASVTVKISEFGEAPMNMPSIVVAGVKVNESDSSYSLAATEFNGTSDTGKQYSGTLQGSSAGDVLNVQFTLNYGAMPMPLICSFTGSK